jgi:hypothetical protein
LLNTARSFREAGTRSIQRSRKKDESSPGGGRAKNPGFELIESKYLHEQSCEKCRWFHSEPLLAPAALGTLKPET